MEPFERKQLLERIDRDGATVGRQIPAEIDVQGETVELRSFVFETKRLATIPSERRERIETLKVALRRERTERVERIETEALDFETADQLADSVIGIDRALSALSQLGPVDLAAEIAAKEAADSKRWQQFLKQALGKDDTTTRGRR